MELIKKDEIKRILDKYNIKYIFYSDLEKKLGEWTPDNKNYIKEVFDNQKVKIYKII